MKRNWCSTTEFVAENDFNNSYNDVSVKIQEPVAPEKLHIPKEILALSTEKEFHLMPVGPQNVQNFPQLWQEGSVTIKRYIWELIVSNKSPFRITKEID